MKLKGQANIDLNNIKISNLDYNFNLTTPNIGLVTKKDKKKYQNGICLESSIGPILININLLTDKYKLPIDLEDLILKISADYKLNKNLKLGLKYDKTMDDYNLQTLSGTINSKLNTDLLTLNLSTENIIYGSCLKNDVNVKLFGNKINPSIGLNNDTINLGYIYQTKEEIDDFGNKESNYDNKLSLDLDIKL